MKGRSSLVMVVLLLLVLPAAMAAAQPSSPAEEGGGVTGLAWQIATVDSSGDVGRYTSVALDSLGRPHVSYYDQSSGALKYASWNGASWQTVTVESGGVGTFTSLAIDSSNRPHISYYANGHLRYAYNDGSWHFQDVALAGWQGDYTSLALDSAGRPRIAFHQTNSGELKYAYSTGSAWYIETVEGGNVGQYVSLAIDSADRPHISYCQYNTVNWTCDYLKYAYKDASWHISVVDSGVSLGQFTSLALDSSDRPHVSYYDGNPTFYRLKYARYTGSWQIEVVDDYTYGGVGQHTSLALDSSDQPHISYYDWNSGDLKYAYYSASAWHMETVDSAGDVGTYTSLALDDYDRPHISYYDSTNGNLKHASGGCKALVGVSIGGPARLRVGQSATYTALPNPEDATEPISYLWDNGATAAAVVRSWTVPGTYNLTVSASNACGSAQGAFQVQVTTRISPFGMDTYFTNPSRSDADVDALIPMAQAIHTAVAREEISWASYETPWGPGFFDDRIGRVAQGGFEIIGILGTTPDAYSTQACKDWADAHSMPRYFCPPANPNDFANYAATVVERYDGDGFQDAPGSPRIAYWEIWNEPDQPGTWLPSPDPVAYAALLQAAYQAIKQADPSAGVLVGGMTDWDTVGLNGFMESVVAAGGWPYFDILSYHPFILAYPPEEPGRRWNLPARLQMAQDWLASHGGGKEAWATEFGWSTCTTGDPECHTESDQASYIVRAYGIILARGFTHADLFQLKHMTGGAGTPYRECAIVREDWTTKPAYTAYRVMVERLGPAQYVGTGVLHQFDDEWTDRHDYRFLQPDGTWVDLLWKVLGQETCSFALEPGVQQVYLYDRDGTYQVLTPVNNAVPVTLSERPQYLVRKPTGTLYKAYLPFLPVHSD